MTKVTLQSQQVKLLRKLPPGGQLWWLLFLLHFYFLQHQMEWTTLSALLSDLTKIHSTVYLWIQLNTWTIALMVFYTALLGLDLEELFQIFYRKERNSRMFGTHSTNNSRNTIVTDTSWSIEINVTGPPGALLFDRDQRSHWNNHYNCCLVWLAALGIYCTDFLPQMTLQVKYPMQFMVHVNMAITHSTALSEEICLQWATMHLNNWH